MTSVPNQAAAAEPPSAPDSGRLPARPGFADFLPIIVATLIWAWPMIFVRYVKIRTTPAGGEALFTPHALNFYRYASAAAVILLVALIVRRRDFLPVLRRAWVPLVLGTMLAVFQMVWVYGVWLVPASYGGLVVRSTMIFSLIMSYFMFTEERGHIRSGGFMTVAVLGLLSVVGICVLDKDFRLHDASKAGQNLVAGTAIFLASSLLWSVYEVTIRKVARRTSPLHTFAATVVVATALLAIPALLEGRMGVMWDRSVSDSRVQLAVFASGALCIGVSNSLYYQSLRRIGVAYSSIVDLAAPFLTGLFAWMVLGDEEKLSAGQWALGTVLVVGLGYMVWRTAGAGAHAAAAAEPGAGGGPPDGSGA
jgi:drug/metabolite transporter (DMT)-like permease